MSLRLSIQLGKIFVYIWFHKSVHLDTIDASFVVAGNNLRPLRPHFLGLRSCLFSTSPEPSTQQPKPPVSLLWRFHYILKKNLELGMILFLNLGLIWCNSVSISHIICSEGAKSYRRFFCWLTINITYRCHKPCKLCLISLLHCSFTWFSD